MSERLTEQEELALDLAGTVFGWQHLARYSGQTREWLDKTLLAIVRSALTAAERIPSDRLAAAEARGAQAVLERVEALADDMDERGKPGTRDSEMDCWSRRQIREDVKRLRAALSDPGTSSEEGRDG